jgi:hypothetical protein
MAKYVEDKGGRSRKARKGPGKVGRRDDDY